MATYLLRADILSVYNPIISKIKALVRRQTDAVQLKYNAPAKASILKGWRIWEFLR
jgi:hypothetical protein